MAESSRTTLAPSSCAATSTRSNVTSGGTIMTMRYATLAVLIGSMGMADCAAQARSPEPVPIDKVACARCRMLISTESEGGEIAWSSETRFYDDVGCLAADWNTHDDDAVAFVRLSGGRWSDAQRASFAQPADARTAMGSGFVAFATPDEARAADRNGRAVAFEDLVHAIEATR